VLTRIKRKSNGPRAALHGAAQQRIWIHPCLDDLTIALLQEKINALIIH
jgi:hypothetical protein